MIFNLTGTFIAAGVVLLLVVILALAAWIDRWTHRGIGPIENNIQRNFTGARFDYKGWRK